MKVVGYIRVSTKKQANDGLSLDVQRDKLELYARLHGHDLVEVVQDDGESAKTLDRPGIQRVIELIRTKAVEGLLIAKLDRLTRSLKDWAILIEKYFGEKRGAKLVSVQDHIDTTTATGRMMLNMIVMVAQWEREVIAERTREILQGKIQGGERCGKVRYGWDLDWSGPRATDPKGDPRLDKHGAELPVNLVANAAEQAAIGLMCRLKSQGLSAGAIAAKLDEAGRPTKAGVGKWHRDSVAKILKREYPGWQAEQQPSKQSA